VTDFISASPLLIFAALAALAWFTGSRVVKLATMAVFFGYPVVLGKVALPNSLDINQFLDFVLNTVSYWLTEALDSLVDYLKAKLTGSI